jgi:hypothetical protein
MDYNRSITSIYNRIKAIKGTTLFQNQTNFKKIKIIENLKFFNKILNIIKLRPILYIRLLF